jgi:hypothetical protein
MRSAACSRTVRGWCPFVFTIGRKIVHALRTGNSYRSVRMQQTSPGVPICARPGSQVAGNTFRHVRHEPFCINLFHYPFKAQW